LRSTKLRSAKLFSQATCPLPYDRFRLPKIPGMEKLRAKPRIVVVGGGIGGLFAANALIARGLAVELYEQAPALGEVGAGVYLTPNAVRQMQRVGLGEQV